MTLNDTMSFHDSSTATAQSGISNSGGPDFTIKAGLAQMLKGGVIMDVVNAEQVVAPACQTGISHLPTSSHRLASPKKPAGACAVMALERVPARHPP
jgi:pyridoxal 5'-phosphate synthase pdxS subunit